MGAGKTTLILKLLKEIAAQGQSAAVIENEAGKTAIDSALLEESGVQIRTIAGGCVCCQLAGPLITALCEIEEEIRPQWCIAELSGIADLTSVRQTVRRYYHKDLELRTIAVVDAVRWEKLSHLSIPLLRQQITGADAIFLSKTDKTAETPQPAGAKRVFLSVQPLLEKIRALYDNTETKEQEYPAEAQSASHNGRTESRTQSYTKGPYSLLTVQKILEEQIRAEGDQARKDGVIPGHIKGIASFDGGFLSASLTEEAACFTHLDGDMNRSTDAFELTINVMLMEAETE